MYVTEPGTSVTSVEVSRCHVVRKQNKRGDLEVKNNVAL